MWASYEDLGGTQGMRSTVSFRWTLCWCCQVCEDHFLHRGQRLWNGDRMGPRELWEAGLAEGGSGGRAAAGGGRNLGVTSGGCFLCKRVVSCPGNALGSAGLLEAGQGGLPGAVYLLISRHSLVRAVSGAGKVARQFGVCCFTLGGLVVIGWFSGEVTLFPRGGRVSVEQWQQGAAGSSWGIVVLWMCNCNKKALGVRGCASVTH